jgi:putative ABC transport system permease protein
VSSNSPHPPRFLAGLSRLLLRGDQGRHVRNDLEDSFLRDLEKGMSHQQARRRYATNLLGSLWSVGRAWLPRAPARGALLDAKVGLRMLAKQPMLTGVAMLALGLGIPTSLVVHHMIGVFQSPLPVPDGQRVMGIRNFSLEAQDPLMSSVHDFARWREAGLGSFESIAAARSYGISVHAGDPGAPPVLGAEISTSTFALLRATPLMGRLLGTSDEMRGAPDVVLLSEALWRARFASDPSIIGKPVRVGRTEHTVVGVMPSSFRFPMGNDVWMPLRASPLDYPEGEGPGLWVFGRLRDGVSAERAGLEVAQMTEGLAADDPQKYGQWIGEVVPMPLLFLGQDVIDGNPDFLEIQAVMLAFLLIVCGNVGTLILARTATRMGELSIRTALGASRTMIVSQLFIEALVLAVVATGLGLLAAEAVAQWFTGKATQMGTLPYWMDLGLNANTVLKALALSVLAAVVAGVLPAFRATRRSVQANLQEAATAKGSVRFGVGSSLLIISEVVLSVGFLAMGGVMLRSVFQDSTGRLGLEPERYLRADLNVSWMEGEVPLGAADDEALRARMAHTQQEVLARLAEEEAVRGVGLGFSNLATYVPPTRDILLEGRETEGVTWDAATHRVDVGFFRGLGRPILAGRDFIAADLNVGPDADAAPVIVNTSFVELVLGGRNAVGQRFLLESPGQASDGMPARYEIVGVVGPFGMNPINPTKDAGFYEAVAPGSSSTARYLVEVAGDPAAFAPRLRAIVAGVDPEATVDEAIALEQAWAADGSIFRWMFIMEVVLAGVAFVLAVSGLYALMSFTVSQRTREVAIRSALGARSASIVSTIASRAAIQLGIGLALGGLWSWVLLGEVIDDPLIMAVNKPVMILVTLIVTAIVGAIGCAAPTIRGLRIQPSEAMRES